MIRNEEAEMLIKKKLNDALNAQIVSELGASSQYLKIASYFAGESLHELAEFFFRQSEEEREHAMKFVHYILEAGGGCTDWGNRGALRQRLAVR